MIQSDRELAEMIARFRTHPMFDWRPLADDIERVLRFRKEMGGAGSQSRHGTPVEAPSQLPDRSPDANGTVGET
jgi:hypothetical protein